jgi:cobalt-zinc-cadmium efflux system membrane fusion protein
VTLLACLSLTAVLLGACSSPTQDPSQATGPRNITLTRAQQQSIQVLTVEPASYHTSITTTGVVDFDHNHATDVLAPFSGPVTRVLATLGQRVAPGQALAMVNSPDFTTAVGSYRKALISAAAADEIATNDRFLYQHKAISERENANAQAAAISADADRSAALQALVALHMDARTIAAIRAGKPLPQGQGIIRAPIGGTVVQKPIAPGQTLTAGSTPCFTIADTSRMWVMAQIFGDDVARVQSGDAATIDTGDTDAPLAGTVTDVGAVVNPDTRSVNARISVDNAHGVLKKQMYVQVHLQSRDTRRGLLIPVSALLRDDENLPFVYVVAADGSYARRSVTLGTRVADRIVVAEGLQSGDRVVVDGGIFLHFIETQ